MGTNKKMSEIWKDVVGYEGLYKISNLGCVKSLGCAKNKKKGCIRKERITDFGYSAYALSNNKKIKWHFTHRLVASAFITNDDVVNKTQVNHKDGNKLNNNVDNLEWCTPSENRKHAFRHNLILPTRKKVVQLDINGNHIREFGSVKEAKKILE